MAKDVFRYFLGKGFGTFWDLSRMVMLNVQRPSQTQSSVELPALLRPISYAKSICFILNSQHTFDHDKGQKSAISGRRLHWPEIPPVLLGIPWLALRGPLRSHFWKKRRPQPYWGGENSGNALKASNALNYRVWGIPAVLLRGIPGNALRAFPGSFRNISGISSGKSQPYWGSGPIGCLESSPVGSFPVSPGFQCKSVRKPPQMWRNFARFPGLAKRVKSCHVSQEKAHKHKSFWQGPLRWLCSLPTRRPGVKNLCAIDGTQGT